MPLVPPKWICFTCIICKTVVNLVPHPENTNRPSTWFCPMCCLGTANGATETRTAVITEAGPIGSGPDPILDCMTAIANALVDIRNLIQAKL